MEKAVEEDHVDEAGQRGQYLWIRGLTRLQHQVNCPYLYDASQSKTDRQSFLAVVTDFMCISFRNICFFCHLDKRCILVSSVIVVRCL